MLKLDVKNSIVDATDLTVHDIETVTLRSTGGGRRRRLSLGAWSITATAGLANAVSSERLAHAAGVLNSAIRNMTVSFVVNGREYLVTEAAAVGSLGGVQEYEYGEYEYGEYENEYVEYEFRANNNNYPGASAISSEGEDPFVAGTLIALSVLLGILIIANCWIFAGVCDTQARYKSPLSANRKMVDADVLDTKQIALDADQFDTHSI